MLNAFKSGELKTIYVTVVSGIRHSLITKSTSKQFYDGKVAIMLHPFHKRAEASPKFSVNDDFELAISLIRNGRRLKEVISLFLHPMLTALQLKLVEAKDESYLRMFANHLRGASVDVSDEELEKCPDSDRKLRFEGCFCIRESFYLK